MEPIKRNNIEIDATGKVLGRLAAEIVAMLKGKSKPGFRPHEDAGDIVTIKNVGKMKITGKKVEQKQYYHHTGYLGGLKAKPLKTMIVKEPSEVLRLAVLGMLSKNRLRAQQIKRLKFQ